ncbi:MAG: hypothetical protein QXI90_05365, partial [Thermofilum sp.]
ALLLAAVVATARATKLILVGAPWAAFNDKLKKICQDIAAEKGIGFEEKVEDYIFLMKHGEKDELGGADIPQVFVEFDDGTIRHVLTRVPIAGTEPDFEEAKKKILAALG